MTQGQLQGREQKLDVSPEVLARICPEHATAVPRVASRPGRAWAALRVRVRLLWTRARFRIGTLQPIRCVLTRWRLKIKLTCMKLRHGRRLK